MSKKPRFNLEKISTEYLKFKKTSITERTLKQRKNVIERFMKKYGFKTYNPEDIADFISGYAPTGAKSYLSIFKDLAKFMQRKNYINNEEFYRIQDIKRPKGGRKRKPKEWTYTEFLDILKRLQGFSTGRAWFIGWNFGLRPQEIYGLQIRDIDFTKKIISVCNPDYLKTENAFREIPFDDEHIPGLKTLINGRESGPLVVMKHGKPHTQADGLIKHFSRHSRKHLREFSPIPTLYDGRYSFATRMYREIGDLRHICYLMGHSDVSMTARYLGMTKQESHEAYRNRNRVYV